MNAELSLSQGAPNASDNIELPKILSDDQIAFFCENGYLILPDLISTEEINELKADTVSLARGKYQCEGIAPAPEEYSDQQVLETILCIHQPHHVSPTMEKYVRHEKVCGALSQITGAHLPHWDGSVKCMQSMLFVKPPGFQGQAWHQDEIYIPTRDRSLIGAWIALDEATIENGCLWVIPGSHKTGYLYPQHSHNNNEEFDYGSESFGFDESQEIAVEVPSGSVVFFNGHLLHRSRKNRSNVYRRVLVNHYMNAWSRLPWYLKEGENTATADQREIIPVAGVDPYAWKGIESSPNAVFLRTSKARDEKLAAQNTPGAD